MENSIKKDVGYYMSLDYPVVIRKCPEDSELYVAYSPALPIEACGGTGVTLLEAYENHRELMEDYFEAALCDGEAIPEPVEDPSKADIQRSYIVQDILAERVRQIQLAFGGSSVTWDSGNSKNDWVAYIAAYLGRASEKVFRNEREECNFKENITKVAALCLAALEADRLHEEE